MMYELQIPALTTLQSADARAIRTIVTALVQELARMQKEIDELKSRPQQTSYLQTAKRN